MSESLPPPVSYTSREDAFGGSLLEQNLEIETPERVRIRYELAGIGSRFAAGTIDALLLFFMWLVVMVVGIVALDYTLEDVTANTTIAGFALAGVGIAVIWAYYLLFELLWNGQTPGKRVLRLRVVSEKGGPASAAALLLRNIVRVADVLPLGFVHLLGGIVMFVSDRSKRLGDIAAGTVVVQEREVALSLERLAGGGAARSSGHLGELTGDELARAKRFLSRRRELRPDRRGEVAAAILAPIADRLDLPSGDAESLLSLLAAGKTVPEIRDLAGPRPDAAATPSPSPPEPRKPGPPGP